MVANDRLVFNLSRRRLISVTMASGGLLASSLLLQACGGTPSQSTEIPTTGSDGGSEGATPTTEAGSEPGSEPIQGGTLTIGIRNYDYDVLDPHQTGFTQVYYMIKNIVDPLVWLAPDLSYQPGLASRWEVSPDATTWTLTLRDDVVFHDGTRFDAEAVKFNLDRMVDPATKSRQAGPLLGPYDRTEVLDAQTAKVVFNEPYAAALNAFSSHFCGMVSPHAVQEWGEAFAQHLTGSGPFIFEKEDPHVLVQLKRNPDYNWAPPFHKHQGPPYLDAIHFKFIQEDGTRLTTLKTGETDVIDEIPVDQVEALQGDSGFNVVSVPKLGIARGYHLNTRLAPTDDLQVRKALEFATDRATLDSVVFKGLYPQAPSVLVPGTRFYDASLESMYPYDPEKAKQILDEAGWMPGSDGIRQKDGTPLLVKLATFPGYVAEKPSELLQALYREVGIDFEINVMTGAAMMQGAGQVDSPYNAALSGTYDVDPGSILRNFFHSSSIGGSNYAHVSDPHLDELLEQGLATAAEEEREQIYNEVQRIIMENALVVPLYGNVSLFGSRASVKNMAFDPRGNPTLYDVYIEGTR